MSALPFRPAPVAYAYDGGELRISPSLAEENAALLTIGRGDSVRVPADVAPDLARAILSAAGYEGDISLDLRPPVPTAPGVYTDRGGEYWTVYPDGVAVVRGGVEVSDDGLPRDLAPFTRVS